MPELKALARECRLRGYSRLRKAESIAFLQNNEHQAQRPPPPQRHTAPVPQMSPSGAPPRCATWEPECGRENGVRQPELEAGSRGTLLCIPLTKRQLKHRQKKDSKLAKKFVSLDAEIGNLKSQMGTF